MNDTQEDIAVRKLFGETLQRTVLSSAEEREERALAERGKYCRGGGEGKGEGGRRGREREGGRGGGEGEGRGRERGM